jgi:hypothetical protein
MKNKTLKKGGYIHLKQNKKTRSNSKSISNSRSNSTLIMNLKSKSISNLNFDKNVRNNK